MIIDGVKMACEACIRGHRVSGCNHSDRKLLPIAKKGRPVSQCNHCRVLRKSRAAHVKCDCGSKSNGKAGAHAQSADGNEAATAPAAIVGNGVVAAANEAAGCCAPPGGEGGPQAGVAKALPPSNDSKSVPPPCTCCHGGQCTCALKKEPQLDAVPEFSEPATSSGFIPPEARGKPRLPMTYSESSLTTFANGRHKPTHKHHLSIHNSAPYSIPAVGHTGHAFVEHNGTTKASSKTTRRTKSEHSSPDLRTYPALPMPNTGISPLELTPAPTTKPTRAIDLYVDTNFPSLHPLGDYGQDYLQSADSDYQISAGIYPSQTAAWPSYASPFSSVDIGTAFGEQPDASGFDLSAMFPPSLTSSTSGDERDDLPHFNGPSPPYTFGVEDQSSQENTWAPVEVPQQVVTSSEWSTAPWPDYQDQFWGAAPDS